MLYTSDDIRYANLKPGHEIYAFAFALQKSKLNMATKQPPVKGILSDTNWDIRAYLDQTGQPAPPQLSNEPVRYFIPYNQTETELLYGKAVTIAAREYADTYQEAAERYNELIENLSNWHLIQSGLFGLSCIRRTTPDGEFEKPHDVTEAAPWPGMMKVRKLHQKMKGYDHAWLDIRISEGEFDWSKTYVVSPTKGIYIEKPIEFDGTRIAIRMTDDRFESPIYVKPSDLHMVMRPYDNRSPILYEIPEGFTT